PAVHVERIRQDVEVEDPARRIGVAHINTRVVVALECVLLDENVPDHRPTDELVSVDACAGGAAGLIVVLDQVVLDKRLRSAAVGETDADDVVLNDVVNNLGAADPRIQPDAEAGEGWGDAV